MEMVLLSCLFCYQGLIINWRKYDYALNESAFFCKISQYFISKIFQIQQFKVQYR